MPDADLGAHDGPGQAASSPDDDRSNGDLQQAEAHFARGVALARMDRPLEAAQAFQAANLLRPDNPATLANLGLLLSQLGQYAAALACAQRAVTLNPNDAAAALVLATVLYRSGDVVAAVPAHRQTVTLAPDNPIAWTALGDCLVAVGQPDEAIACFRRALMVDPTQLAARRSLAASGRSAATPPDIDYLSGLLDRPDLPTGDRIDAGFALGQILDREGRVDEAFARFAAANDLVRATQARAGQRFDADAFDAEIDRLIAAYTPSLLAFRAKWGNPSELPVFIVGMPRSGSTLLEQILASHSQVCALGESKVLSEAINAMVSHVGAHPDPVDWVAANARGLADRHLASLIDRAGGPGNGKTRIVDKLLDNVLHLGLIATLFPNASVIICRRDPRDVCLSCYFHRFAEAALYTYDLIACARRARAIDRLIAHWRAVLPIRMYEVVYENLVANPIEETWRLLDFLGLAREAASLAPHQTDRVVTTTSAWQVREPIHTRSVGRWRAYRRHLPGLLQVLESA
jgi:thioredoxin-like negative regulator of GroEL